MTPTTLAAGGALTATYTGYVAGAVWICYRSGSSAVSVSPPCAAAGTATSVTAAGSGTAVACTASATNGNAVSLTWTEVSQTNIWARACTTASDAAQAANANVALTAVTISVVMTPTTLAAGGALTATYTGYVAGAVWICYRSGSSAVSVSPPCAAAGTATSVTAARSDFNGAAAWDLQTTILYKTSAGAVTLTTDYTQAYWIWWDSDSTNRLFLRALPTGGGGDRSADICGLGTGSDSQVGMWNNGAFTASEPAVTVTTGQWTFLLATSQTAEQTTKIWKATASVAPQLQVFGVAAMGCGGLSLEGLGSASKGAGVVARIFQWSRVLTQGEIMHVYQNTKDFRLSGAWCDCTSPSCVNRQCGIPP